MGWTKPPLGRETEPVLRFLLPIALCASIPLAPGKDAQTPPTQDPLDGTTPAESTPQPSSLTLDLPPSAAARAWSLVGPGTIPQPLPKDWTTQLASDPWARPETFTLWANSLRAAKSPGPKAAPARALLAFLAAAHRRPQGAWNHVAGLAETPEWVAALVPRLLPGVPLETKIQAGGVPAPLIRGVRLNPIAPPRDPAIPAWAAAPRKAQAKNLRVEDSIIDLEIDISGGGIELLLTLGSGPSTAVTCSTPFMPGFRINSEYLDFERQEPMGSWHLLVLTPDDEEPRSLYARVRKDELMLPTAPGAQVSLSHSMRTMGMVLLLDKEPNPRMIAAAAAFSDLLGVPVTLGQGQRVPHDGRKRIDLVDPARREILLRALCNSIEERVLHP